MTCHKLITTSLCTIALTTYAAMASAQIIPILNPGGEEYAAATPPNVAIDPGGVSPIESTGWNSTIPVTALEEGVEAIGNSAHSGEVRLAFGAINTDPADTTPDTNLAEDFILFQETSRIVSAGDAYNLSWFGRGFFQFDNGVDFQTSLFGYLDGGGNLVAIDTLAHPSVQFGAWSQTSHSFTVPGGSPLIGENLVIGFFTDTPDLANGGFSSVDDIVLSIPSPFAPGDVNEDGDIDLADVQIIADNFRESVLLRTSGDLNLDGSVNFLDFRIWKDAVEPSLAASLDMAGLFGTNVPEPGTCWLAGAGALLSLGMLRRRTQS